MPAEPSALTRRARIGYFCANLGQRGLIELALLVPYRWRVPAMGWLVSRVIAPLAGSNKRIRTNLKLARPDLPETEVRRLCRAVPDNAGRTLIELYSGGAFLERARAAQITGPGFAALETARASAKNTMAIPSPGCLTKGLRALVSFD